MTIRKFIAYTALAFLSACASAPPTTVIPTPVRQQPKPELPRVAINSLATYQLFFPKSGRSGSSVVLTKDGWVLTAWHVVADEQTGPFLVKAEDGGKMVARMGKVMHIERNHDLALVKFATRFPYTVVVGDDEALFQGDSVYHVGYPYNFHKVVIPGTVASLDWTDPSEKGSNSPNFNCLLVSINLGHGSSGGGLYSGRDGRLIGTTDSLYQRYDPSDTEPKYSMTLFGFVQIRFIRAFLDRHHIDYRTTFEEAE
ncbi:MAG: serine protease [Patescibacteria group bacterium]|nr:serine protease [Patescibacteria group bacterium]